MTYLIHNLTTVPIKAFFDHELNLIFLKSMTDFINCGYKKSDYIWQKNNVGMIRIKNFSRYRNDMIGQLKILRVTQF